MDVAWKNLSVSTSKGRVILEKMSGYAQSGQIIAIMGPSGSGKSTLLDSLAGRLSKNATRQGSVYVNGHLQANLRHGIAAYVTQQDTLIGTLTVLETICYSANLRLPHSYSHKQKIEVVDDVISEMGLEDCRNTMVGNWQFRGLSGGEKRRVSIALEILTQPSLLFLDEPTSGLDSASAYFVVKTIKNLAHATRKRTVIASIHQPGSEVFEQFDNLCLLSQGSLIYFGDASEAGEFFVNAGFPCPPRRNPSDHYLHTVNSDFEKVQARFKESTQDIESYGSTLSTSQVIKVLVDAFQTECLPALESKVEELSQKKGEENAYSIGLASKAGPINQVITLTRRSFKNMTRDLGYYWLRIFMYLVLSVVIGNIYFDVGKEYGSIASRVSCMSFINSFLTFMSTGGFPSFIEDVKVFYHESQNGHYGELVFVIANTVSSAPYLFLISLGSTVIFYNMVKLHPGFHHFAYFVFNLFAAMAVVESLMMCVATVVPNFLMGVITGAGILGLFLLVDGFFKPANELPKVLWKYPLHYVSFHTYLLQGLYQNDFLGLEFDNVDPSQPRLTGRTVLNQYQVDLSRSKWVDFAVLFLMIFIYRALFVVMIKVSRIISLKDFHFRRHKHQAEQGE